jgi:hypothetical protein
MYAWSPTLAAAWRRLLEWTSARAGVSLDVMDAADPTPLDDLWQRDDLGCVFTRFVPTRPEDFRVFLERQRAAEAAGYPKLA